MSIYAFLLLLAAPTAAPSIEEPSARFDHIALHVADVEKSVAFYRRIFGLVELPVPVIGPRWLSLGNSAALHLIPGRQIAVADYRYVHLALAVDGFDAMLERLRSDDIPFGDFAGNIGAVNRVRGDGVRQIFLRDPDGYWIEVNDAG